MDESDQHRRFMREAIREASFSDVSETWPNPRVGAVIVEQGLVVSRGRFRKDGGPHAEREALANLGRLPRTNATLYVTLEPCSTHGRTGACTDAILKAGIKNVVIGALDPTPSHRGAGLAVLRKAGLNVVSDILKDDCESINPGFEGRETP
jgi:diaminohydroxyphosphoribosylaminopyrimidine deaminase/5-amino-6-(5-phosphoribosylamino)uracil reductase